jgi:hypothetical protein
MARPSARRHEDGIRPQGGVGGKRVTREPSPRGPRHACPLARVDGGRGGVQRRASLDLDEGDGAPASDDQVDLPARGREAPGKRPITLQHQRQLRQPLGR